MDIIEALNQVEARQARPQAATQDKDASSGAQSGQPQSTRGGEAQQEKTPAPSAMSPAPKASPVTPDQTAAAARVKPTQPSQQAEPSRWQIISQVLDRFSGHMAIESQMFFEDPQYYPQKHDSISLAFEPEYYQRFDNGASLTFKPFMRYDNANAERTHVDVRELSYLTYGREWELRVGVSKVFWGVAEAQHLVDVINQTDFVENIDGEDKLGQPMVYLSLPKTWGIVDLFVLPAFRERTYPGQKGRLRTRYPVDNDMATYEHPDGKRHVDGAARYSNTWGGLDLGVSYFYGTNREPTLVPGLNDDKEIVLKPRYEIIGQAGLDMLYVTGGWMWKLEAIHRQGQADDAFFATTSGFEYTLPGSIAKGKSIGLLLEWLYDQRGEAATTAYDNDLMVGTRLALNDIHGSQALIALIQDLDSDDTLLSLEASRRIDDNWKINLESTFVLSASQDDSLYSIEDDDNVRFGLFYYF